ncbi:hypothetical protein ASD11_10560 [Aeromicrobium sp. Root495]|uniref:hypothetical protein n=1 Tax=Aeromicrobium sp. Root495 TaxID=1736550 RepID=UPI0006F8E2F2|nr:hypothetical protein [Aeromicrobium sp. Root495]KQY59938.1 hypothetical protein ASD11_10560 [Aeromicrobium sp. Root495]
MRFRWILLSGLVVAAVLVAVTVRDRQPVRSEYCTADVGDTHAQVDVEQAQWSALMSGIAQRRGLPPRATTIAIATAFQESKIHNIDYGDRDSLGLFQQRPSQGWGTAEQVQDPQHSINAFYDGLVKVKGYSSMEITEAAQAVQRSAFPAAYAAHEAYARALASALRGYSPATFSCQVNEAAGGNPDQIAADLKSTFGDLGTIKDGTTVTAPVKGGKAADVTIRGWAVAHYLVANASRLNIESVSFDRLRWTARDSPDGWVESPRAADDRVTATVS